MDINQSKNIVAEALATFKGTLQEHNLIQTAFKTLLDNQKPEVEGPGATPTPVPTSGDTET